MDRIRRLGRLVAQQTLLRDRARARVAALDARAQTLTRRERDLREPVSDPLLNDLLLPIVARRLAQLAAEHATIDASQAVAEGAARKHAGFARVGEKRLLRAQAELAAARHRSELEEIAAQASQPLANQLPSSQPRASTPI